MNFNRAWKVLFFLFLAIPASPFSSWAEPLGAVATQHPLATETAVKILQRGGNAIDAAVGAALTLAVVEPYYSGLGAGGFAVLWEGPSKKATGFDFRERAPLAATPDMFIQLGVPPDASENGPLAIAVPGEIHGLAALHRHGGHLPWADLFSDAIRLAEVGFKPDETLLLHAENKKDCLRRDYHTAQIYQPLWSKNSLWSQPALAATLKRLAQDGPEIFYHGAVGAALVSDLQGKGAILSEKDLAEYQTVERIPVGAKFSWGELWGFPLPSSGGISIIRGLQTMAALEKLTKGKNGGEAWIPWMVQVLGQLFQTRNSEMGDADFISNLPVKKWLSKDFAKEEAKKILEPSISPPATSNPKPTSEGQTTHLSVMDGAGNAVTMTLTQNLAFGSCVTSGQTGILLNDQMDDFSTHPGQPNFFGLVQSEANGVAPGKRPLSTMSPTVITRDGQVILALGTRGGPRILSTLFLVLYRHFFLSEALEQAIAAPRFHYQGTPNKIDVEQTTPSAMTAALEILKLPLEKQEPWCDVEAVSFDLKTHTYSAFSDPRSQGKAVVVFPAQGSTGE